MSATRLCDWCRPCGRIPGPIQAPKKGTFSPAARKGDRGILPRHHLERRCPMRSAAPAGGLTPVPSTAWGTGFSPGIRPFSPPPSGWPRVSGPGNPAATPPRLLARSPGPRPASTRRAREAPLQKRRRGRHLSMPPAVRRLRHVLPVTGPSAPGAGGRPARRGSQSGSVSIRQGSIRIREPGVD